MVRAVADRAFLPAKSLFEQVGEHDDPDREDGHGRDPAALSLRRRVHRPVPLRPAAVLVPDDDLDRRLRLRRPGPPGGQLPLSLRRARPPRRLLRPGLDPRVRPLRDRGRGRRGRRDRDHRRSRRPQDPRGARRPAGARRRPDQEPRRAALPRPDADHRAARHLRAIFGIAGGVFAELALQRSRSGASSPPSSPTPRSPTSGARSSRRPCSGRSSRSSAPTRG